jgi:hypothetical protein
MALFSFAVCYFRSFIFPDIPIVLWGDQVGFLNDGSRLVQGELPYRDYFQIVPPAMDLTYAFLIRCFGLWEWIPNLLTTGVAAVTVFLTTMIAAQLMRGAVVVLPGVLFTGFVLLCSNDATHHWFSTIAILGATLVLLDGITLPRVAAAGVLCGTAACFTQSKGATAIACLLAYLAYRLRRVDARERWGKYLLLCGAAAAVFAAVNAYFIRAAGIGQWLYCLIVFPLRYYPAPLLNNWRVLLYDYRLHIGITRWVSLPFLYAMVPLTFIVLVIAMRRGWDEDQSGQWHKVGFVAMTGTAMFLAIASSPSGKRLATVSPPALILLAWLLDRPEKVFTGLRILLGGAALALAVVIPARVQSRSYPTLGIPAGRVAFTDPALYDEYRWLLGATHPGEYLFGLAPLYFSFHVRNAAAIEGVHDSDYTRPEQVSALMDALETHRVRLLVLRGWHDLLHEKKSPTDHLDPLRSYIGQHYRVTKTFSTGDEVLERIEASAAATGYAGPS